MNTRPVEVLVGQAVDEELTSPLFLSAWRTLHGKCKHATAFQSPSFVCPWYRAYRSEWEPVMVRSWGQKEDLEGLWLLAHDFERRALAHAGAHQAEYHTWLALPGSDEGFLAAAWTALTARLKFGTLRFKYLPRVELARALESVPRAKARMAVRICRRPLAKLDPVDIAATFAKKSNKSRFNRLKKLGALEFRRIADPAELEQVLDDLIAFYDFRQAAVNHVAPFREDAVKRAFHRGLFAATPMEQHVTVTYLDGRAIAAFWGTSSGTTVHLGMLIHSPLMAEHSPGKLHIMQLSNLLLREGKEILDLTPGGDPWKERFANAHDEVADVVFYRSAGARKRASISEWLLRWAKRCAARVGIEPSDVRRLVPKLQRARIDTVLRMARNYAGASREFRIYRGDSDLARGFHCDARVACNSLADLLRFEPGESWQSRDAFLSAALSRLERGETAYTICVDNRLAHCGWMVRDQKESYMTEVQQSIRLPSASVSLYDFYTHPDFRRRGLYRATISHMVREAFARPETRYAYISVLADNLPSRHVIESLGFEYQGSLYWQRRLGSEKKWADPALTRIGTECAG